MRATCQREPQRVSFAILRTPCWKASSRMCLWSQVCNSDDLLVYHPCSALRMMRGKEQ